MPSARRHHRWFLAARRVAQGRDGSCLDLTGTRLPSRFSAWSVAIEVIMAEEIDVPERTSLATTYGARLSTRTELALLLCVLVLSSARLLVTSYWKGELFGPHSPLLYQASTLGFNYFEMGAIRRGLGGSLVHLLGHDQLRATAAFHLLSAMAVALAGCLNIARLNAPVATRALFAFVLVSIMLRWAEDAGRTDMAVAALLACAAWAVTRRMLVAASAFICVGLFVHETSVIYGVPLLIALMWKRRLSSFTRKSVWVAAAVFVVTFLAYAAIVLLPHADRHAMAEIVRAKLPPDRIVDWGIYFALSGVRGVQASICQNRTDPNYWLHTVGGLAVIATMTLALARSVRSVRSMWVRAAIAALPPFFFMCLVANDTSRWTMLASFNAWLVMVSTYPTAVTFRKLGMVAPVAAIAFLLLSHPKPDKIDYPIYAGSPLIEQIAGKLKGPHTPNVEQALQRCDPGWHHVLDDPTPESRELAPPALP
jgi:hypothetical protein